MIRPSLPSTPIDPVVYVIDIETYYDDKYSLKKLATSAYIRHEKALLYGIGIAKIDLRTRKLVGEVDWVAEAEVADYLSRIDWSRHGMLCHNTAFDGLWLSHHYGVIPAFYFDTLSMARGLHDHSVGASLEEVATYYGVGHKVAGALDAVKGQLILSFEMEAKLAAYCINDVELTIEIFFKMLDQMPQRELDLIHITLEAFCNPVLQVNEALAQEELDYEIQRRKENFDRVAELVVDGGHYTAIMEAKQAAKTYKTEAGYRRGKLLAQRKWDATPRLEKVKQILSSNDHFPSLVERLGETVATKPGKKGDIPAIAKDDLEFQRLLASNIPGVSEVAEARLATKSTIGESRAARLLDHAKPALPIMLNYCKAHTMRWSGGDKLNPQNFPANRKGNPARLRRSIEAPEGYVLVVVDSSQIEDRMNCWIAGQGDILKLYAEGGDPYLYTAETLYGVEHGTYTKEHNKAERGQGKVARLGLGYGCGAKKFRLINQVGAFGPPQPDYSIYDATKHVGKYRKMSEDITGLWEFMDLRLAGMLDEQQVGWQPTYAECNIMAFEKDRVNMPNGLSLHYPDLHGQCDPYEGSYSNITYRKGKNGGRGKIYGGLFTENVIQCLARIVVGEQMHAIAKRYRIVMMTHDEVVFLAPQAEADEALDFGLECFRTTPDWCPSLPLDAEGGYAREYSK